jgi:hypothetical protein
VQGKEPTPSERSLLKEAEEGRPVVASAMFDLPQPRPQPKVMHRTVSPCEIDMNYTEWLLADPVYRKLHDQARALFREVVDAGGDPAALKNDLRWVRVYAERERRKQEILNLHCGART